MRESARAPTHRVKSGRLLAIHNAFLILPLLKDGARVTIVGEVTGATMGKLDEADYRYPTVEVKHLHRCSTSGAAAELRGPSPYWGVFGGVGVGGGTRGGGGISIGTGF
ncbi:MAG: Slp family lipoprotein [Nitrospiraceae bacterium]